MSDKNLEEALRLFKPTEPAQTITEYEREKNASAQITIG
jgi:hypothetical protein